MSRIAAEVAPERYLLVDSMDEQLRAIDVAMKLRRTRRASRLTAALGIAGSAVSV
jgi:hypothetical protein